MSLGIKRKKTAVAEPKIHFSWKEAKRQKALLIWSGIIVIYGIIFYYLPLGGWVMAFQNYRPIDGLLHSEFVGLQKFQQLFSDATFLRVIRNTLAMGVINLVVTFVFLHGNGIAAEHAFAGAWRVYQNAPNFPNPCPPASCWMTPRVSSG